VQDQTFQDHATLESALHLILVSAILDGMVLIVVSQFAIQHVSMEHVLDLEYVNVLKDIVIVPMQMQFADVMRMNV